MIAARILTTIPAGCTLGEGPVWDDRRQWLWFTDIQQAQLLCWDHCAGRLSRHALPERLGSLALTDDPDVLLCALASGLALLHTPSGAITPLHSVEPQYRGMRLNDGRVDRQGRFWVGSMVEDRALAPATGGSLYRLDPPGTAPPLALRDGIAIANCIAFSPDGRLAYFADTPTRRILCHPVEAATGPGRLFAETDAGAFPDGADVDADGRLWNAEWGAARISVYQPDGRLAGRIALPVSQPTCVAFGGANLDLVFVTSAREGLSAATLADEPLAGDVLVLAVDGPEAFRGLPAGRFALGRP